MGVKLINTRYLGKMLSEGSVWKQMLRQKIQKNCMPLVFGACVRTATLVHSYKQREKIHVGDFLCPQWSLSQCHNNRTALNESQCTQGLCDAFIMSWLSHSGIWWVLQLHQVASPATAGEKIKKQFISLKFPGMFGLSCLVYLVNLLVIVFKYCIAIEAWLDPQSPHVLHFTSETGVL